jgi:hypothetical protein
MNVFYYLNDDHTTRPCDVVEWAEQLTHMMITNNKNLKEDTVNGKWISTIWLGIDHNYLGGLPLIFETMVFNDGDLHLDEYCDRYSTWDEAIEGHQKAIQWVLDGCKDEMD